MPGTPETILAFDFGLRRIGVAVGQQVTSSASPIGIVTNGSDGPDWEKVASLLAEWRPARLIVGMPFHADGTENDTTAAVKVFIGDLDRFGLPVDSVDERYSSIEAQELLKDERSRGGSGRISKEMIDSAAAKIIAERWLKKTHQLRVECRRDDCN
ncbi:MAG: putative Holliday junction resolvase [Woeseiaceae bacterium]|jgi:putative Holliday junction resolvase